MQRFRGGLVFKPHRIVYHSTLGLIEINKKKKSPPLFSGFPFRIKVWAFGFRVLVLGFGFWVLGFGVWVLGFGFWVLGFGFWVLGLVFLG